MANFNSKIINLAIFSPQWYLMKHITDRGHSFTASAQREIAQDAIAQREITTRSSNRLTRRRPASFQTETSSLLARNVSVAREVLLQPSFTGKGASGTHGISFQMKCDVDIRQNLYAWPNTSICTKLVNLLQILHVVPRVTPSSHKSL